MRDRNDRRHGPVRWAVWLVAGSVAVLLTVRALDDDVVEVFDAAITALGVAERALDSAVADIGAVAEPPRGQDAGSEPPRGQDAGSEPPGAMSAAARRAESAARAAGRASTETRTVLTRVRHMRMERSGTFAEALATVRGLRDATRALMAAVEALRDGAEALREAGAVRAAHRALLAADATLDAAQTVLRATEAALDDERFDSPPAAGWRRVAELADGRTITVDVAFGLIEFMGDVVAGTIIFGDADAEPLLGVTALESAGIEVDPVHQRLKKLPAVRLKGTRRRA